MSYRCSSCRTKVAEKQNRCHKCGAIFANEVDMKKPAAQLFSALTGHRSIDEIKEDWLHEARKAIVGGTARTFGIDKDGEDTFKSQPKEIIPKGEDNEIIEADFRVIEEEEEVNNNPRFKKPTTMEDLPKNVQDALKERVGKDADDSDI